MIRLDNVNTSLEVVLSGAVATTQPQVTVCYSTKTSTAYTGAKTTITTNDTTNVTIVSAPVSGAIVDVDFIEVFNRDTASVTVTIQYNVSSTRTIINKTTLLTDEALCYTHAGGWKAFTSTGALKTSLAGIGSGTVTSVDVSGGTTGLTTSGGPITTSGTITIAGTLIAANGGTGFASYAVGDILYADTTTTLAKLADVAAGSFLRSGGVSTAPLWSTTIWPNATTANRILYSTSTNTIGESANLTFDGTNFAVTGNATVSALTGLGGATNSAAAVTVGGTNPLTGTTQTGVLSLLTGTSAATTSITGVDASAATTAAAFTAGIANSVRARAPSAGAGSTITRAIALRVGQPSAGTNNAAITDNITFTGSWFLHQSGTSTSKLAGTLVLGDETANIASYQPTQSLFWQQADTQQELRVNSYTSSAANSTNLVLFKGRGTAASPANIQNGDTVGSIIPCAVSGSAYYHIGSINAVVDGTFTSGQNPPSRFDFYVGPADTAPTLQMTVANKGLGVGTTTVNPNGYGRAVTVSDNSNFVGFTMQYGGADADGNFIGEYSYNATANTSAPDFRIAAILGVTQGSTANWRGGQLIFRTRSDGGSFQNALTMNNDQSAVIGTSDPGGSDQLRVNGALTINSSTMIRTFTSFTNGAGASVGTLTNAPAAGDPTKWIAINDNGTTRYIPAW